MTEVRETYSRSEMYFYGIVTYPPTVIEFDMSDPKNVIINKIFTVANSPQ